VELSAYAIAAGLCRQKFKFSFFVSLAVALIAGRLVYIAAAYIFISGFTPLSLITGIYTALLQLIILPFAAEKWTQKLQ
ncbi:hypothetical protein EZS27_032614, partial [termite gut metagenome]